MLEQTLNRTQELIRAVDVKTALYMGMATGMTAGLPALAQSWERANLWIWFILAVGTAGPACCAVCCGIASFPYVSAPQASLLFFGTIVKHTPREYVDRVINTDERAYCEDLGFHVLRNAVIADWKYKKLKLGLHGLMFGLPLWLTAVYLLASGI